MMYVIEKDEVLEPDFLVVERPQNIVFVVKTPLMKNRVAWLHKIKFLEKIVFYSYIKHGFRKRSCFMV